MNLKNILAGIEGIKAKGDIDIEITSVKNDSRKVENGDLFISIKGYETDGADYVGEAIEKGAKAVLVEEGTNLKELKIKDDTTLLVVPDARIAMAKIACNYYDNPSRKFQLIGVTGTKGKTTTTYMIKSMLEKKGLKVGLIGTIHNHIGAEDLGDSERTTPESLELQELFAKMAEAKCDVVVMEVSSQSLKLNRVYGSDFNIGIFTNLSEEHISEKEHADMKEYFETKCKLFTMCKRAYINADDLYSIKLPNLVPGPEYITYGIDNYSKILAKDITITNSYVDFRVKIGERNERVKACIPGRFSVYNSLAAIAVALQFGCDADMIKEGLVEVRVPGRSEMIDNKLEIPIMIDYAHSPESLESILNAVKSYTRGRVICVFGCGGNRDKNKRPLMGEIAGRISDYTIITSDNPRDEEPSEIIKEIEEGIKKTKANYKVIEDRKEAIKAAIEMANKLDIVVIAGKGHEMYQEVKGKKNEFNEKKIVIGITDELKKKQEEKSTKKKK